eukprot:Nitzschia sp. Nitz4//scaffold83_size84149//55246//56730//NITZ4_005179-RA/size84149-snap-gene-0.137-mRNA-1//-1//CDS//3329558962//3086//frame0
MVKFSSAVTTAAVALTAPAVSAQWYTKHVSSNVDALYYRNAMNVVQDLETGAFQSLHIVYHSCVWSEYDGDNGGCGGNGGGNWYEGSTQCFRANVAYSLYGVKNGQSVEEGNECTSANYIDSFFTKGGIESFGDSVGVDYDGYGAYSACEVTQNNGNNNAADSHGSLYYSSSVSSALGCSAQGQFVQATFRGAYCDGSLYQSNNGAIDGLNYDLESLGCYKIYDFYGNVNGDEEGEGEEDKKDENAEVAAELLEASATCSHEEYPNTCPDPHGVKKSRDVKAFTSIQSSQRSVPLVMPIISTLLLICSACMYCLANGVRDEADRKLKERESGVPILDTTIYEQFSQSFDRAATGLSQRMRTYTEKLAAYAEELEDDVEEVENTGDYVAPEEEPTPTPVPSIDEAKEEETAQKEVADAILSDKGAAPAKKDVPAPGKKYKRPRMARISRWFRTRFGRKNRSKKVAKK